MKRYTYVRNRCLALSALLFLLLMAAAGCSGPAAPEASTAALTQIPASQWPENSYTALLPQPEHGQVTALYETADGSSLGITLADLTREEAQAYQGQLEQAGFTLQFSEKEEASAGVILQREDVTVSLAYGDGTMGIWITLRSPDSLLAYRKAPLQTCSTCPFTWRPPSHKCGR